MQYIKGFPLQYGIRKLGFGPPTPQPPPTTPYAPPARGNSPFPPGPPSPTPLSGHSPGRRLSSLSAGHLQPLQVVGPLPLLAPPSPSRPSPSPTALPNCSSSHWTPFPLTMAGDSPWPLSPPDRVRKPVPMPTGQSSSSCAAKRGSSRQPPAASSSLPCASNPPLVVSSSGCRRAHPSAGLHNCSDLPCFRASLAPVDEARTVSPLPAQIRRRARSSAMLPLQWARATSPRQPLAWVASPPLQQAPPAAVPSPSALSTPRPWPSKPLRRSPLPLEALQHHPNPRRHHVQGWPPPCPGLAATTSRVGRHVQGWPP